MSFEATIDVINNAAPDKDDSNWLRSQTGPVVTSPHAERLQLRELSYLLLR